MIPWCSDSWPSVGLTVTICWRVSCTGSAPAFSTVARSFACCSVKLPVITPVPPVMADWTVGAEMTTWSTTIASCLPIEARGDVAEDRRAVRA